jgi:hypothetical protein
MSAPQTPVVTCQKAGNIGRALRSTGGRAAQSDRTPRVSGGSNEARTDQQPCGSRRRTLGPPPSLVEPILSSPRAEGAFPSLGIRRPDVCSADARRHLPRSGQRSPPDHRSHGPVRAGNEAPPSKLRPHGRSPSPRIATHDISPQHDGLVKYVQRECHEWHVPSSAPFSGARYSYVLRVGGGSIFYPLSSNLPGAHGTPSLRRSVTGRLGGTSSPPP